MSTLSIKDFSVGQELFFVPSDRRVAVTPRPVKIERIGREWVTASNGYRFSPPSMCADGGQFRSPGSFWVSVEAHDAYKGRIAEWSEFRKAMDTKYSAPDHLTTDQIRAMTAMVKGEPQ